MNTNRQVMSNWQQRQLQQQQMHRPAANPPTMGSQGVRLQPRIMQASTGPAFSIPMSSQGLAWQEQPLQQQNFRGQGMDFPATSRTGFQPAPSVRQEVPQASKYDQGLRTLHQGLQQQCEKQQQQQSSQQWQRPQVQQHQHWQQQQQQQVKEPLWQQQQLEKQLDQWQQQPQSQRHQWEQQLKQQLQEEQLPPKQQWEQQQQRRGPSVSTWQEFEKTDACKEDSGAAFFTGVSGKFGHEQLATEKPHHAGRGPLNSFFNEEPTGSVGQRPSYQRQSPGQYGRDCESFKNPPHEDSEYGSAFSTGVQSKVQSKSWGQDDYSKPAFESQVSQYGSDNQGREKPYSGAQGNSSSSDQAETRQQMYEPTSPVGTTDNANAGSGQPFYSKQSFGEGHVESLYQQQGVLGLDSRKTQRNVGPDSKRGSEQADRYCGEAKTICEERDLYGDVPGQKDVSSKMYPEGTRRYREEPGGFNQRQATTSQWHDLYRKEQPDSGLYSSQRRQVKGGYYGNQQQGDYLGDKDLRQQQTNKQEQAEERWRFCELCSIRFSSKEVKLVFVDT